VRTNISTPARLEDRVSNLLALIGQPARVQILLVISAREACVCHLEAALGMRQASISQHLMALRKAGLVTPHRDGRNIYYRLTRPEIIEIIHQAVRMLDKDETDLQYLTHLVLDNCPCPHCSPGSDPRQSCQNLHPRTPIR